MSVGLASREEEAEKIILELLSCLTEIQKIELLDKLNIDPSYETNS
jgi:hypothetical protein